MQASQILFAALVFAIVALHLTVAALALVKPTLFLRGRISEDRIQIIARRVRLVGCLFLLSGSFMLWKVVEGLF